MAGKEYAQPRLASSTQDLRHICSDLFAFCDLLNDTYLHVVDKERHSVRITQFLDCLRYFQTKSPLHATTSNLCSVYGVPVRSVR